MFALLELGPVVSYVLSSPYIAMIILGVISVGDFHLFGKTQINHCLINTFSVRILEKKILDKGKGKE